MLMDRNDTVDDIIYQVIQRSTAKAGAGFRNQLWEVCVADAKFAPFACEQYVHG